MAELTTVLLYPLVQIVNFSTAVIWRIRKFFPQKSVAISEDIEAFQILYGEHALHDVMGIVCKYMDTKSLYNMTGVCKSWRIAALREKNKRMHLIKHLPFIEQWNGSFLKVSDLRSNVKAIPFASLFFYKKSDVDPLRPPQRNNDREDYNKTWREHIILTKYNEQLPRRALAFRVDQYFTMERAMRNGKLEFLTEQRQNQGELTGDKNIMGLLFPSKDPRVCIHAATIMDGMLNEEQGAAVDRLTEELGLNDCNYKHSKSTILMFSIFSSNPFLGPVVEQLIESQAKKRKEITFAGFYGSKIRISDDDRPCVCCGELRLLLSISGPRVESWSTFIYFYEYDIHGKLDKLKTRVKRKRHNIGLVYAPRCTIRGCNHSRHPCGNSIELMKTITSVFPYIRFTGLFLNHADENGDIYGWNFAKSYKFCNDVSLEKQGSCYHVSIIIISHD